MANIEKYTPGQFCWAELATTDGVGAAKFYAALFGFEVKDFPLDKQGGIYHMMQLAGRDACAGYQMGPNMKGIPPHWTTFINVANVDEAVKKAEGLGGKAMMPAMDVFSFGRCAFMTDPTGASFALWQPRDHIGASVRGGAGATCWNELCTSDAAAAKKFYTEMFGWQLKESPEYNEITNPGDPYPQGGIMQIRPAMSSDSRPDGRELGPMPSNWSVYFAVDALDASVEKATGLGAKVVMGPQAIPNVGRFAVLQDPQGAFFDLYEGKH